MADKNIHLDITSKESRSDEEMQKVQDASNEKSKGVKNPYSTNLWKYIEMLTTNKRLIFIKELVIMAVFMLVLKLGGAQLKKTTQSVFTG